MSDEQSPNEKNEEKGQEEKANDASEEQPEKRQRVSVPVDSSNDEEGEADGLTEEELDKVRTCDSVCNDEEFMWEMIEATQKSITEKLQSIESAVEKENYEGISRSCHTIKGSAKMLSLVELGNIAEKCEKYFKVDQTEEGRRTELLNQLRKAIARLNNTKRPANI